MIPHHIRLDTVAQWCRANMGKPLSVNVARDMFAKRPTKAQMENTFHRATDFVDFSLTRSGLVYETPEVRKERIQSERKEEIANLLSRLQQNADEREENARRYALQVMQAEKERKALLARLVRLV